MTKFAAAVFAFVIIQRLAELCIAARNERWMRSQGAVEAGSSHYKWMVSMHTAFFFSVLAEVFLRKTQPPSFFIALLVFFLLLQLLRIWCLSSLGKFWNTKILVVPGAFVKRKGPYRFMRHPNYAIVSAELLLFPSLFGAYMTAALFTALNCWMLAVRIPAEERALRTWTNYSAAFTDSSQKTD